MAWGSPVAAASTTALPEVVGDGGLLLDPDDPKPWSEAMRRLLDDHAERQRLIEAGSARAASFSWRVTAAKLVELYGRVLAGSRPGGTRR
jgi:alpha-1,3-rhamnosyl/mannosyltransferase